MTLHSDVVSFVDVAAAVIPHKTLTTSRKEYIDYNWWKISDGNYLCEHKDNSYVVSTDNGKIGCSCPAMAFHCARNDVCKHIAVFMDQIVPPHKPIQGDMIPELLKAGWTGAPGSLEPPERELDPTSGADDGANAVDEYGNKIQTSGVKTTSDEDGDDNGGSDPVPPDSGKKPSPPEPKLGEKVFEKVCPHCGEVTRMTDAKKASAWLKDHVATCKKKPVGTNDRSKEAKAVTDALYGNTVGEEVKSEMDEQTKRVIAEAEGLGATDINAEEAQAMLHKLQGMYHVIRSEAERSVITSILNARGIKRPSGKDTPNVLLGVGLIDTPKRWINIRVRIVEIWDNTSDSIKQVGLVGDETGTTKFVSWKKSDLALFVKDKCYSIENVVTDEYEERFSVKLTKNSVITEIDDDIQVEYATVEFTGTLVEVQEGSGLIKRCPTCAMALKSGSCKVHGNVDGTYDMRIKATLDDGVHNVGVLLNQDRTTQLTGIELDSAIAIATDALDMTVVADRMATGLLGREYVVSGSDMGGTILVESIKEVITVVSRDDIDNLLGEV